MMPASRDSKPPIRYVSPQDLRQGEVYFSLSYIDFELTIPVMVTLVYIGSNLNAGDRDQHYFQDAASWFDGVHIGDPNAEEDAEFWCYHVGEMPVLDYEEALLQLAYCSRQRRPMGGPPGSPVKR